MWCAEKSPSTIPIGTRPRAESHAEKARAEGENLFASLPPARQLDMASSISALKRSMPASVPIPKRKDSRRRRGISDRGENQKCHGRAARQAVDETDGQRSDALKKTGVLQKPRSQFSLTSRKCGCASACSRGNAPAACGVLRIFVGVFVRVRRNAEPEAHARHVEPAESDQARPTQNSIAKPGAAGFRV